MRKCKQCDEELWEGETEFCATCYDYVEAAWRRKRKAKEN